MEHKPIVEKLLEHYKDVYGKVNGMSNINSIQYLLEETNTSRGICSCANKEFDEYIYEDDWVLEYGDLFWGAYPRAATTKERILSLLQIRIDNLTKELELINAKTADNG